MMSYKEESNHLRCIHSINVVALCALESVFALCAFENVFAMCALNQCVCVACIR